MTQKNKRRLKDPLEKGELVLFLAERLKKEDTAEDCAKLQWKTEIFFNKYDTFLIRNVIKADETIYLF